VAKLIGELLVEAKALTREKLEEVLRMPREAGKKIGQVLLERGLVTEAHLTQCLSFQLGVPWVSLYHIEFSRQLLAKVPRDLADRYGLVPIYVRHVKGSGDTLYVATEDPANQTALSETSKAAGLPVRAMIASPSDIRSAIRVYYPSPDGNEALPMAAVPPTSPERKPEPPPLPPKRQKMPSISDATPLQATKPVSKPPPPAPPSKPPQAPSPPRTSPASQPDGPPTPTAQAMQVLTDADNAPNTDRPPPPDADHPDAMPDIEARELTAGARKQRMVGITLLDGTSLALPTRPRRKSEPPNVGGIEQLTSRDLISALRALSHGADVTEILGDNVHWEAMFAALLSLLLKKGLLADWEFIEELRKI
jgi:type IV pilus assembly protein PilB